MHGMTPIFPLTLEARFFSSPREKIAFLCDNMEIDTYIHTYIHENDT